MTDAQNHDYILIPEEAVLNVVRRLFAASTPFEAEPWPEGQWALRVRPNMREIVARGLDDSTDLVAAARALCESLDNGRPLDTGPLRRALSALSENDRVLRGAP